MVWRRKLFIFTVMAKLNASDAVQLTDIVLFPRNKTSLLLMDIVFQQFL